MPEVEVIKKQAEHLNNEMVKNTFQMETWNMIVVGDSTKRFESLFRTYAGCRSSLPIGKASSSPAF